MVDTQGNGVFTLALQPDQEGESLDKNGKLESLFRTVNSQLGGTSLIVELTDEDYRVCFNRSLSEFRAKSSRSVWEGYGFLELQNDVQAYTLHEAIDNVTKIYRKRALFGSSNGGFDYFAQVAAGLVYPGGSNAGGYQGIATYDFALQYEETLNRAFARDMQFRYRPETQTLYILQLPRGIEMVVLGCSVLKSIQELLSDHWAERWLTRWTLMEAMEILSMKRGKFSSLPGPQGGVQMNGAELSQKAEAMRVKLEDEIDNFQDGGSPAYPILA